MKGLILAGGHGTRLRPLTYTGNKHMLPIANQPILYFSLRHLAKAGIKDVAIILGPINEGIKERVGDGNAFGLNVEYISQGEPKGLAHAVLCAREFLADEPFLMYLGDNLLQSGVSPFITRFQETHADAVVGATQVADPRTFGVVEIFGRPNYLDRGKTGSTQEQFGFGGDLRLHPSDPSDHSRSRALEAGGTRESPTRFGSCGRRPERSRSSASMVGGRTPATREISSKPTNWSFEACPTTNSETKGRSRREQSSKDRSASDPDRRRNGCPAHRSVDYWLGRTSRWRGRSGTLLSHRKPGSGCGIPRAAFHRIGRRPYRGSLGRQQPDRSKRGSLLDQTNSDGDYPHLGGLFESYTVAGCPQMARRSPRGLPGEAGWDDLHESRASSPVLGPQ